MLSFVVPAHNEETLLGRTLDAIRQSAEAIGQAFEIVVVDDASTDRTAEIGRDRGAIVVQVNHRQIAATRNAGARAARGERLFFVDADTVVDARVLGAAQRALDNGAVGGGAPPKLEGPVPLYAPLFALWFSVFMRIAGLSGGAFLFCTRGAFDAVGGFNEQLFGAEDAALSSALRREGRFVVLWQRVLTSGRRVRTASGLRVLGFFMRMAILPSNTLKRRANVEKMWYESNRERDQQRFDSLKYRASNAAALAIVLVVVTSPVWMIPLPESLNGGLFGTVRYSISIFMCHFGLVAWPCAYFWGEPW